MYKVTETTKAPAAIGPYSQAISCNGILYCSGQIPISPETGAVCGDNIEDQTKQVISNIKAILDANGIGFENVIKTTCYLADMDDFDKFNAIYAEAFVSKPARSCVAVKTLPKKVLCEIEVLAVLENSGK
ncbi:MAG: regulator [Firmicutes bacterium]|jgi:2-iminobutanoate/2-iminopropanoate deaminase|nr:regulator [Bacillota bacterium]